MHCLFVNPPRLDSVPMAKEGRCMQRKGAWGYIMSPVTMVTMATLVQSRGHSVSILDCAATGETFESMLAKVAGMEPEIVFINTATPTIRDDIQAARLIKNQGTPSLKTVMFGLHPTSCYADLLQADSGIDICILGEPEETALNLVEAVSQNTGLKAVDGIAFLDDGRSLVRNRLRAEIAELDTLPVPDWSLVDIGNYRLPLSNEPFLLVNTNRGCPFSCSFCNAHLYYGHTPRRHSIGHIMDELCSNVRRFGVRNFMFWAEEFTLDRSFVLELCDAIVRAGLNIRWVCNSRVDAVDSVLLAALKQAGCWNIAFGIESGNQKILDSINKQITLEQITHAVALAKQAGLQVTGHVIVGFPQDTRDTIAATERFINSLELDFVQYYCAIPYPGTKLYQDALANGWLTADDWERWEHNRSVLSYGQLTAAEIMQLRRRLMLRWYFSPKRIVNTMKNHIKKPSDLIALLSSLRGFIRWM